MRIRLVGAGRLLHITVTETLGPAVGAITLAPSFPHSRLLVQTDASTALAFLRGRSKSACLQQLYTRWRQETSVQDFLLRSSGQLVAGKGNVVDDAGSRGYWNVLNAYTAACGVRLTVVEPPPAAISFLADALLIALAYSAVPPPPLQPSDVRDLHLADAGTMADVLARAAYHRSGLASSPAGFATLAPPRLLAAAQHDAGLPRPVPIRAARLITIPPSTIPSATLVKGHPRPRRRLTFADAPRRHDSPPLLSLWGPFGPMILSTRTVSLRSPPL